MNYTDLVADKTTAGSIKSWVNNGSIPSTTVLAEAEQWIYQRIRVPEMLEVSEALSMSVDDSTLSLPTGFQAVSSFRIRGADAARLQEKRVEDVEAAFNYDGAGALVSAKPSMFYVRGAVFQFDCPADQAYDTRLVFYGTPTALGGGNTTNFLTDRYARILRSVCIGFANEFLKDDDEKAYWLRIAEAAIAELEVQADLDSDADFLVTSPRSI